MATHAVQYFKHSYKHMDEYSPAEPCRAVETPCYSQLVALGSAVPSLLAANKKPARREEHPREPVDGPTKLGPRGESVNQAT